MGMIGYKPKLPYEGDPMQPFMPQMDGMPAGINPNAPQQFNAPRIKPSFFGEGGTGRTIAGVLGDILASQSGGQAVFMPQMLQQRQQQSALERGEQQYQRRRQDENSDWMRQAQFTAANRAPTAEEQIALNAGMVRGSPEWQQHFDTIARNKEAAPMQLVTDPTSGEVRMVPRVAPQPTMGGGGVPDAAVQYLRQNPGQSAAFDAKYGQGASQRYLNGGAASQGAGGFR